MLFIRDFPASEHLILEAPPCEGPSLQQGALHLVLRDAQFELAQLSESYLLVLGSPARSRELDPSNSRYFMIPF